VLSSNVMMIYSEGQKRHSTKLVLRRSNISKRGTYRANRGIALTPLMVLLVALVAIGIGCSRGSYPLDPFQEMHYSQSYRLQEPPFLDPPADAIPITGEEAPLSELMLKENPIRSRIAVLEEGAKLYAVNCASCHGINADGQSFVADKFSEVYNRPPSLRDSALVKLGTDGTVFSILTNGVVVMPSFKKLLTERERWILVHHLKSIAN
jgi:mono/diheme cytochrome c family protein